MIIWEKTVDLVYCPSLDHLKSVHYNPTNKRFTQNQTDVLWLDVYVLSLPDIWYQENQASTAVHSVYDDLQWSSGWNQAGMLLTHFVTLLKLMAFSGLLWLWLVKACAC